MKLKKFLIFDFGASNGRASIAHYNGKKINFDIIHRFDNNPVFAAGTLYWDFLRLLYELKKGLSIACKKFNPIESLGIDTWGVDFGLIDKNGKLISNSIHYRDKKRNNVSNEVFKIISKEELFKLTGCSIVSYYSIFNLYALQNCNATEYIKAFKFLMMPDLFNYFLTGETFNEYTNAHTTILCNPFKKDWEDKIIKRFGFNSDIFCKIIQPGSNLGKIQGSICSELEISPITVIVPATHDTASAIAGVPIVDNTKNAVFISLGTWGIIVKENNEPIINKYIFQSGFANEAGAEDKMMLLKNFVGLWLIQQCRNRWLNDLQKELTWDDIMLAAKNTKSIGSFIDIDAPIFILNQSDMPKVIREFCIEKGQKIPENIGQTARVIYESMVFKIKYNIADLEKITGKKLEYIHIIGGGTKDKLLCQWIADATRLPVFAGPIETTSIGNLLMQLKSAGEIKTLDEGRQISLNSSVINNYTPQNSALWGDLYTKYLKIL